MINRKTFKIDATGISLGRVATEAAVLLMGKNRADFTRNQDKGEFVKIVSADKIKFTGNKFTQKLYYRPTRRVGALRSDTLEKLWKKDPSVVIRKAVYGMLPKNSLRKNMIKRLIID